MKRIAFLLVLFSLVVNLYSQTEIDKKNTIGVHFTPGLYVGAGPWTAAAFGVGVDYLRKLSEHWSLCSGFEQHALFHNGSGIKSEISFIDKNGQLVERTLIDKSRLDWAITTIPVQFKYYGKRIYLNFGPHVNIFNVFSTHHLGGARQVTIGWEFGIGFEHELNNGITLSLNPKIKSNGIITRALDIRFNNDFDNMMLGIKLGVGYKF